MRKPTLASALAVSLIAACAAPDDGTDDRAGALGSSANLYREGHTWSDGVLTIDLAVRNLTYHKACAALITGDQWMWMTYEAAHYVEPIEGTDYERWRIELDSAVYGDEYVATAATLDYALVCHFDGDPTAYWDNNGGEDYHVDRSWPSDADRLDTVALSRIAVTEDGGIAAVDGDDYRTVAFYDADGALACLVDVGDYVVALEYVAGADVVLVESYAATWPERRWRAYTPDGAMVWDVSAALEQVVPAAAGDPGSRPLLVGTDGAAVIGRTAPTVVGPTAERCSSFPVLTTHGRMLCRQARGVYEYDVYACGSGVLAYPDGIPWAADDDGHAVLAAPDRGGLTGYDGDGNPLWTVDVDYLWTPYPLTGGSCTNAATGGVVAYSNGSWPAPTVFGLDLDSGAEVFAVTTEGYGGACVHADGRYYLQGVYQPGLVRIDAIGEVARYRAPWGIQNLRIDPAGRVLAQVSGYHEPYDPVYPGRVVVLDDTLVERLSVRSDVSYPPGPPVFALTGPFAAIGRGRELTRYAFEVP